MRPQAARYDGHTVDELASDAEAALAGILHLTENHDPPPTAEAIYRALSGLTRTLDLLPDAVTRLHAAAVRHDKCEGLKITSGPFSDNPTAALDALQQALDAMLSSFGAVRTGLYDAQAALAGVSDES